MIRRIWSAEWLKVKRTWIAALTLLGPAGIIACLMVDYAIRSDYILKIYPDEWTGLILEASMILPTAIMMGVTLFASLLAGLEHQTNAWKYSLALPLSRFQLYLGKGLQLVFLLFLCSVLTSLGFAFLWVWNGFEADIPWLELFQGTLYPLLAALPVIMIQLWLSVTLRNQALPITVGVLGATIGAALAEWLPWAYPTNALPVDTENLGRTAQEPEKWVPVGIVLGILLLILGGWNFTRREVK
ncbi:ABC transporter permease [Paludifilum halophilum]|uniref:Permease n=1 Tax=Paludifilum halophilum TaxID=1642702 RepID=A0A235B3N3_9BACL|nr:ABC transporter permease [Paludifilum halophilum]OYD06926.1 hypothetical protein CHM34_13375 [Paludifilum halophilum]